MKETAEDEEKMAAPQEEITRKDKQRMTPRVIGIGVGLVLGFVWMSLGFWAAVLTGGLALVGWFVGSLIEGTINIVDVWNAIRGGGRSLRLVCFDLAHLIKPYIFSLLECEGDVGVSSLLVPPSLSLFQVIRMHHLIRHTRVKLSTDDHQDCCDHKQYEKIRTKAEHTYSIDQHQIT